MFCLLVGGAAGLTNMMLTSCIASLLARCCSSSWAVRESKEVVIGLVGREKDCSGDFTKEKAKLDATEV